MKTQMKIRGSLLSPLAIGSSAFIREGPDTRRTSIVKAIYAQSKSAVVFETQNTVYFEKYSVTLLKFSQLLQYFIQCLGMLFKFRNAVNYKAMFFEALHKGHS